MIGVALMEQQAKKVFIFLDTEKHASVFDILTTIDIFPNAGIVKYEGVTPDEAERIVYDAMFPRGPEGAKHTKIFINGHDFRQVNEILERTKKCMFAPFELAIIVDPRGAYTTAAAAVAKMLQFSLAKGLGTFEGKTATVLAGTGPVGQTAARLLATEKANVIITSREQQKASAVATRINEDVDGEKVRGVEARTLEEIGKSIANSQFVLAAGAAGTLLLPLDVLKQYGKKRRIVADINAIPPPGVEGLESDAEGKELAPNSFGVGALVIGKLKNKIETSLIAKAAEEPKGVFDYRVAYEIAKKTVTEKQTKAKGPENSPQKHWLP